MRLSHQAAKKIKEKSLAYVVVSQADNSCKDCLYIVGSLSNNKRREGFVAFGFILTTPLI